MDKGIVTEKPRKKHRLSWRAWHKWVGLCFSIFIMLFCFSGIIMNHRQLFSGCEVSRWWLPEAYHINNWNQGVVKGTMTLDSGQLTVDGGQLTADSVLMWGQTGLWLTDATFSHWTDFNQGIAEGIDNRKISDVIRTGDGRLWCSALYDAYIYNNEEKRWQTVGLPGNDERVSDIALRGQDTVVVITRSSLYEAIAPQYQFVEHPLAEPDGYVNQTTLFKTFWMLHSGDLFGLAGRLVVDLMGIVLIVLCLTGIIFFVLRQSIKHTDSKERKMRQAGWMKWQLKWHNRFGAWMIVLTLLLSITGMCLRPPFMIPLVMTHHRPVPGSTMASDNVFHDKLRAIRWDDSLQEWLISTSEGFYRLGAELSSSKPVAIQSTKAPQVSPMGMNVWTRKDSTTWLVGSFSGLFEWNPAAGSVIDWFTGEPYAKPMGYPIGGHAVTGLSNDIKSTADSVQLRADSVWPAVVFEYAAAPTVGGVMPFDVAMPEVLKSQPMSLWNFALELHVGRCYEPFLGSVLSVLFVFLSGLLLTLVLLSGYIVYRRSKPKKKK